MKPVVGVSVLLAVALGLTAGAGEKRANAAQLLEPNVSTPRLSASRLLLHGQVRCTATVQQQVEVGQGLRVAFTLHNVSKRPATISLWVFSTGVVLRAADGTTYNSNAPLANFAGIPPPVPHKLRAGATSHLGAAQIPVRWSGPLRIAPECLGKALPGLSVSVTAPGPPPDDAIAISDVVAASGHLLDQCSPQTSGLAVYGQIYPPAGNAPPLNAQCSVSITPEGAFSVAQVLVVTPADLPGVQIYDPYETLWPNGRTSPIASNPPYEAIAWEFVVTRDGAVPVAASTQVASKESAQSVDSWYWQGTSWHGGPGTATCGGDSFGWGGTGPSIEFISVCPA